MNLGEVYFWETENVEGHDRRGKFHVFICAEDDVDGHTFLFINTMDWYLDYRILEANYDFLEYDSFVGCSNPAIYTTEQIAAANPRLVGQLSQGDLKALRDAIIAAETMETHHQNRVCKALAAAL